MKLNKGTFAYTVYTYCFVFARKLFNDTTWSMYHDRMFDIPNNTNLCKFMRSVFIWSPIYFLLIIGLVGGYGYAIFYLPYLYGGAVGYYNIYGVPLIAVGVIAASAAIIRLILGAPIVKDDDDYKEEKKLAKLKRQEEGKYTMWEIIVKYYKSTKEKVCPLIEVIDEGERK